MLGQIIWRPTHAGTFGVFENKRVRAVNAKIMGLQVETMFDQNNEEQNTPELVIYRMILTWKKSASAWILAFAAKTDLGLRVLANCQVCDTMAGVK